MGVIGLISDPGDPHTKSIAQRLKEVGCDLFVLDSVGKGRYSYLEGSWIYEGKSLEQIHVYFFRNMLTPLPPARFEGGEYTLYKDWYAQYMRLREIFGVQLSWLYALQAAGKIIVNPPTAAGIGVVKPHQLYLLNRGGFPLPPTLITNSPEEARAFVSAHRKVIYKPAMGGAFAELMDSQAMERLEAIRNQYVIFQEFIQGADIRVTATEEEILAVAELESQSVDFRATPGYMENKAKISEAEIPQDIADLCIRGIKLLGLRYSGIDLKRTAEGRYVFLEFNVHPAFLWIEKRIGKPISLGMARFLAKLERENVPAR